MSSGSRFDEASIFGCSRSSASAFWESTNASSSLARLAYHITLDSFDANFPVAMKAPKTRTTKKTGSIAKTACQRRVRFQSAKRSKVSPARSTGEIHTERNQVENELGSCSSADGLICFFVFKIIGLPGFLQNRFGLLPNSFKDFKKDLSIVGYFKFAQVSAGLQNQLNLE